MILIILIIAPEEEGAEVVRRIYREYLEGASLQEIGRGLEADGILTGAGKKRWRFETIQKILKNKNEKYIGDALQQKTYTVDFLNKKRVKNTGIMLQYYVEGNHEPIIPRDIYMRVQEEMLRRWNLHSGKKRVYPNKYALSGNLYCGKCDEIYRLRELKQSAMMDSAGREGMKQRIDEMRQFLDEQTKAITEYDEQLTRRLIEKITIYEDHCTVAFKSGTSVDIHR